MPNGRTTDAALAAGALWLAVESIDSPGNLGTIIRTAEAAGVAGIFLLASMTIHLTPLRFAPAWDRSSLKLW